MDLGRIISPQFISHSGGPLAKKEALCAEPDRRPSMPNPRCSLCRAREEALCAEYEMKLCRAREEALRRRGSRISAKGGRQGTVDLMWDGDERFLTYANTDLQLLKMFIAIL